MRKKMHVLCLVIALLTLLAGAALAENTGERALDGELQRAIQAGLMPETWVGDLNATATFDDYAGILSRAVTLWDAEALPRWEEIARLAAASNAPMKVEDGYVMLSHLWVLMGRSEDEIYGFLDSTWELLSNEEQDHQMVDLSWNYPCFPDWEDEVYAIYGSNYVWGAVQSFPMVMSPVSGEFMFSYDAQAGSLHLSDPLTRDAAVRALLRMLEYCRIELQEGWGDYVAIDEAGTYDGSIITDDLLSTETALPEVTQTVLPIAWKGAGLSGRKQSANEYLHFQESDVRFLKENGFNFGRLFFSFETLRYPDYPEDPRMVNANELRELDQMLAWCLKYDIHLQISMSGYMDESGRDMDRMPENDSEWGVTRDYWEMLARRYAGIPSRYLSFDLCNEYEPDGGKKAMSRAKKELSKVVDAVRAADPERVLLYSQGSGCDADWTEVIASLGVAVGCHPYKPNFITAADAEFVRDIPGIVPCWPQPYFPMGQAMEGRASIVLRGDVSDAALGLHVWSSGKEPRIDVYADDQLVDTFNLEGELGEDGEYHYGDVLYSTDLPQDAREVRLQVEDEFARIDAIMLEKDGVRTVMVPSDTVDYPDYTEPLPLIVNGDGSYQNSDGTCYDEDFIYEIAVRPFREIAEKHGVGFMCNEFGMYGTDVHWNIDVVTAFHETYLNMLEKYDIAWCYCEQFNAFPKHLRILYGDEAQWTGATTEVMTYTYDDGTSETITQNRDLVDLFRKHLNQ